ncbi:hypothetical protein BDN70DRAFT_880969 [Pholiota conissans]|uniref:Cryptic loci regulator 2 N-terminal domain-containing protein n=1 Tax=Pholiota conissans TaxID=109636 RepID=A0A9P5YYL7_9AGAR|nr:hypothetical protein BDN70DRAFT_880969 [Pholiota conissans]
MPRHVVADSSTFSITNPSYIDFPRTDGSPSTWPPNTARIVDSDGHVNFYAPVDLDQFQNKKWRANAADAVSMKLKMPDGPNYVFRNFPDGYRLYDHHKGPADSPRHDLYLFGPQKKRFRSINEFIPHAIWLMGSPSEDCLCKYCAKKAQREITASMSTILRTTPTSSPMPSRIKRDKGKGRDTGSRVKDVRPRDVKTYAAVQRTIQPMKASANVLKQPMLVERSNDLRGLYSKASMSVPRWFREGEVVWCALEHPIPSDATEGAAAIKYWPAVIDDVKLKTKPIPRDANETVPQASTSSPMASTSATSLDSVADESERGPILEPSAELPPWRVEQYMRYKVQFLGISHSIIVDNENILPYQAYMPTNEIMHMLAIFPVEKLHFDKPSLSKFNPCPGPIPPSFEEAVPPYAVALQIGSTLSSYWCLTDDYELKCSIPLIPKPPLPGPSSSQFQPPRTLQEVIEAASRHNAQVSKSVKSPFYEGVSTLNGETSESAINKTATRVLGVLPPPDRLGQTRFQGLWWGAERIWADDFIRLKIPRRSLAPNGENNILPPSGPGKSSLETWITTSTDTTNLGAGMRGVFLRLDGILAVKVQTNSGLKTEARVCGMLYELADEDWVDPIDGSVANELPSTNQTFVATSQTPAANGTSAPGVFVSSVSSANGTSIVNGSMGTGVTSVAGPSTKRENGKQIGSAPKLAAEPTTSGPPHALTLPLAPEGYKFRPILKPGHEFVGAMSLISGRYYPRLLSHPKMEPIVRGAVYQESIEESNNLWALEGLSGGYFNSVDPVRYKKNRLTMLQDADTEAIEELEAYKDARLAEKKGRGDANHLTEDNIDAMDVDDIYA